MAGLCMAERRLISGRDEIVPLSNKMDQAIASAISRALFQQKAPTHIKIMNAKRNAKGVITAITHPNVTGEMALHYSDIIITPARTIDKGVMDVKENVSWERLNIHAVPLVRYMGKGTEGLHKMQEEFEVENECIVIPTQVQWLPYIHGVEAAWRDCHIVGSFPRNGEQGRTELSQERHQGGGGVVPSQNVHEGRIWQQV